MSAENKQVEETIPFLDDSPNGEFSFLPNILNENDTFLDKENVYNPKVLSPKFGEEAPSSLFPALTVPVNDELSEIFYIVNPITGLLEEEPTNRKSVKEFNFDESLDEIPSKRQKMSVYEQTLLKNFSDDMRKEQKLLAEEHEMKMKLWDLQMQTSQQEHALKMEILKEQLEKVQQEKRNLELPQNLKHLSKFKSGPI